MLAKNVNDNARCLVRRGVLEFFASKLAPTGGGASGGQAGGALADRQAGTDRCQRRLVIRLALR
ncbi:hypothetical protein FJD34_14790 [Pseudomonas brenneri]|uniref:Uncharacterized protein n=1 Tax=Pseudomonas brenneri TaxID=129817 RepID=A0A5B2V1X7_9PSED|nr:hypothetical protein F1720_04190 [Pseudomonas brenneri]TWR77947.1 hypothetical protein FJD34_14790 [Pseudomonas brenneri]